jgi:hypothetical protein
VRRSRRWRGLPVAVFLLLAPLADGPAEAHAVLVRSAPPHRAVLAQTPERVDLWFSEPLEAAYSMVSVWNEAGGQVDDRNVTVGPDDPRRLSVSLSTRAPGLYTVKYRVLSVDGHVVESRITFTVKGQSR